MDVTSGVCVYDDFNIGNSASILFVVGYSPANPIPQTRNRHASSRAGLRLNAL